MCHIFPIWLGLSGHSLLRRLKATLGDLRSQSRPWDNLSTRRKTFKATLMFKIIKGLSPAYLQDLFSTKYNLRDSEIKLNLPKPRTNYCKPALGYRGALLWNSLPINLRKSDSLGNLTNFTVIVSRAPTRQSCKTVLL